MDHVITFDRFRLDPVRRQLHDSTLGRPVALAPRVFDTLLHLVRNAGGLVTKSQLIDAVWHGVVVEENSLSQAISQLRRALGDDGVDHRFIVTAPGKGYRFVAPVADAETAPPVAVAPPEALHRSLAVLAFANLTGDPANDYLGDGFAEEILDLLASCSTLRLAARSSSFAPAVRAMAGAEAARALGVDAVLEGSVRAAGQRLRVSARLIDGADGFVLWAQSFDRELADIFTLQAEVATAAGEALSGSPTDPIALLGRLGSLSTAQVEAHQLVLKARPMLGSADPAGYAMGIALCEEAVARAPDFLPPIAMLAGTLVIGELYSRLPDARRLDRADALAQQAITLAPDHWTSRLATSSCLAMRGRMVEADRDFRLVVAQRPGDPLPHLSFSSLVIANCGHLQRSVESLAGIEPLIAFHPGAAGLAGMHHAFVGDDERALHYFELATRLGLPRTSMIHADPLALVLGRRGDYAGAAESVILAIRREGDDDAVPVVRAVYDALSGTVPRSAAIEQTCALAARDLERLSFMMRKRLALFLAMLGEPALATQFLRRAVDDLRQRGAVGSSWSFLWLAEMRGVRRQPGFVAIARDLGMVDYWEAFGPPDGYAFDGEQLLPLNRVETR